MGGSGTELSLLSGTASPPELGTRAIARLERAEEHQYPDEADHFERSGAVQYRAVPLLRLVGASGTRQLVVGRVRIAVHAEGPPEITLVLNSLWSERDGWAQSPDPLGQVDDGLIHSLAEPAHEIDGDERSMAATIAKAIAESAHNEVTRIRGLRYELERRLADQLAQRHSGYVRPLLAEMIELSIALNRARDEARTAIREGLWLWLSDRRAYDLSRSSEPPGADAETHVRRHSAGIRHCEATDALLGEETSRLHSLLDSMSTVAVAQDTEAQQNLNLFAAAAAAGLGLPALILSLYSAQSFLPLSSFDHAWRALLPIGATALGVVLIALYRMPWRARLQHYAFGVLLVVALMAVLWVAGALVPAR